VETAHLQKNETLPGLESNPKMLWKRLLGAGIVTLLLGISAILLPFIATLTIQAILAAILIVAGITHLVHAFQSSQPKGFYLRLLGAALYGFLGVILLAYPLKGALTLTALLAFFFMISGVFKVAHALAIKPFISWPYLMFSGVISILLGLIIWLALPNASNWAIGLLVGIELIFSGWAMIMYAFSTKKYSQEIDEALTE
jgi:uncharacterized membrane protein HdeD (DUF308 family)